LCVLYLVNIYPAPLVVRPPQLDVARLVPHAVQAPPIRVVLKVLRVVGTPVRLVSPEFMTVAY
jgi:hypothetical protein